MKRLNHVKFIKGVLIATGLLAPFVYYSTERSPWVTDNWLINGASSLVYPIQSGFKSFIDGVQNSYITYFDHVDLAKENLKMKQEVRLLKSRLMDYAVQKQEIARLRKILRLKNISEYELIPTEVVGRASNSNFRSLRISAGQTEGVQSGMPLINEVGVIGKALRVGQGFSDVQLLTDVNFYLDIIFERNRLRGLIKGTGDNYCIIKLHRSSDIKIGDTLITSGVVGGFPRGLRVGKVVHIGYEATNPMQVIKVQPWVNTKIVDEAFVIHHTDEYIDIIEKFAVPVPDYRNSPASARKPF